MNRGSIIFDCGLKLRVTQLFMKGGAIHLHAEGRVTTIPAGVIPYAIYGEDDKLVAVGRCDWDKMTAKGMRGLAKGNTLVLSLALTIDSMSGVTS